MVEDVKRTWRDPDGLIHIMKDYGYRWRPVCFGPFNPTDTVPVEGVPSCLWCLREWLLGTLVLKE